MFRMLVKYSLRDISWRVHKKDFKRLFSLSSLQNIGLTLSSSYYSDKLTSIDLVICQAFC